MIISAQRFCLAAALLLLGPLFGCRDERRTASELRRQQQASATAAIEQDHIHDAWGYLAQSAEADAAAAADRVTFHLNSWIDGRTAEPKWEHPGKMLQLVAARFQPLLQDLSEREFKTSDFEHLQTSYLFSHIVRWATEGEAVDPLLREWIDDQKKELSEDAWRDLHRACRLFDWTVRNVQVEPFQLPQDGPQPKAMPPGIFYLAPGYRQTSFETVWHGSGDSLQRMRVFIQLCRQLDIPACAVAILTENQLTPWLCGVCIDENMYLFEPQLGLPVPGPEQRGVATLKQTQEDGSILRRLNVQGWFEYPVAVENLKQCVALIDATPSAMSRRMAALEQSLTGDKRMRLAVDVEKLSQRLIKCQGISGSGLWSVPFEAEIYHQAIERARRDDAALNTMHLLRWGMLRIGSPLAIARWQHLTGQFAAQEIQLGARKAYQAARMTEADIESLPTDVNLQIVHGVRRAEGETPEQYQMKIQTTQRILKMAKLAASYWLGVMLIDEHRFDSATTWLDERFLESGGKGAPMEHAAQYCLARAYENLDRTADAIEIYKSSAGPQEHGNRIRARLLERQMAGEESSGEGKESSGEGKDVSGEESESGKEQ